MTVHKMNVREYSNRELANTLKHELTVGIAVVCLETGEITPPVQEFLDATKPWRATLWSLACEIDRRLNPTGLKGGPR